MRKRQSGLAGIAAVAALFAAGVTAGEVAGEAPETTEVTFNGVQVHIDPKTGRLRAPTAAERQALSRAIKHDLGAESILTRGRPADEIAARATLRTSRSGRVGAVMQLPYSHASFLVAERQADGSIAVQHADGHHAEHADAEAGEVGR